MFTFMRQFLLAGVLHFEIKIFEAVGKARTALPV